MPDPTQVNALFVFFHSTACNMRDRKCIRQCFKNMKSHGYKVPDLPPPEAGEAVEGDEEDEEEEEEAQSSEQSDSIDSLKKK